MPSIGSALDVIDQFVKLGKELASLPALVLPQYRAASISLYEICQKLLIGNENLARWLYNFQYFDFNRPDARSEFLDLCKKYRIMKSGPERRELKFRCADIGLIYRKDIELKIGGWFTNQQRVDDVRWIFGALSSADGNMIDFIDDQVLNRLDAFETEAEGLVRANDVNGAEAARLRFKAATTDVGRRLEQFSGELSDLVIKFAGIGGVPVTLAGPSGG